MAQQIDVGRGEHSVGSAEAACFAAQNERNEKLRKVRTSITLREIRSSLFGRSLFSDPAWEIMLVIFASELEGLPVRASDLVSAIPSVPTSTLLRFLDALEHDGRVVRSNQAGHEVILLTEDSLLGMHAMFEIVPGERLL